MIATHGVRYGVFAVIQITARLFPKSEAHQTMSHGYSHADVVGGDEDSKDGRVERVSVAAVSAQHVRWCWWGGMKVSGCMAVDCSVVV